MNASMQRLFFALWPSNQLRAQLAAIAAGLPSGAGRPVPAEHYHITLVFIGNADESERQTLETAAAGIARQPFRLWLDRFGYWPGPAVAWLAPTEPPAELLQLAADLRAVATAAGCQPEQRGYRPHVTLLRKVRRQPDWPAQPRLVWQAADFVLCRSVTTPAGGRYEVLQRWPLNA